MMRFLSFSFVLMVFFVTVSYAAEPTQAQSNTQQDQIKAAVEDEVKKQNERKFAGLDFGVGISLTKDLGTNDRVEDAEIVDGIVRVSKEKNANARIMLESHFFFTPKKFLGIPVNEEEDNPTFGCGPFLALQPGTDEIIEAIGLGVMVGWKRSTSSSGSWNLGIGTIVDPNVKILGEGFEPNKPPPGNETQVRYKEAEQWGVLFLASFTF